MHVLVTGGAGFIGSHLADSLIARGDSVTVLDDLSTGSIGNIRHLKGQERFQYVIDSVMRNHYWLNLWMKPMWWLIWRLQSVFG